LNPEEKTTMKQRIPNPKILCCASIFALSLAACGHNAGKLKTENLADNGAKDAQNHIVKLKKGHRSKKLGLAKLPDPRSYDNLWDRLFDRFDLPEVSHQDIDRELNWFINHPTYIERVQSRAEPFLYSIVKQLEKNNLPGELALLPVIESAFQPHVVSPAHAAGIWQFIPATGRHYGLKQSHSYDGRRDIYASTRAAIKYLKKLRNDFNGDWLLAIAGYNCGEGAVARAIQRNAARGLPTDFWSLNLPQETRSYVPRLLAVAKLFSESEQYGFELRPIPNQALYKTVKLNNQVDLALAANAAEISLDRLFELNPGFKRQHVDLDGSYRLFIPAHKKIVDFKEELSRQMANAQNYSGGGDAQAGYPSAQPSLAAYSAAPSFDTQAAAPMERRLPASRLAAQPAPEPAAQEETAAEPAAAEPPVAAANPPAEAVAEPAAAAAPSLAEASPPAEPVAEPVAVEEPAPARDFPAEPVARSARAAPKPPAAETPAPPPAWPSKLARKGLNESSLEPALRVADYERIASAAAKEPPPSKTPPKAAPKSREEPPETHPKTAEREAASHDEQSAGRGGHKAGLKSRDEPPAEHRPGEPEPAGKKVAYVVREGDTVYSIARKHDMDVDDLKKMNRLSDADDIKWGQSLTVLGSKEKEKESGKKTPPGRAGASAKPTQSAKYTAHDGETLFSISRRFNVTVADLRKWNGIKEDRQFRAGMNITVSGEKD
jgi:membrane-bound lytic murein transglycosylase D